MVIKTGQAGRDDETMSLQDILVTGYEYVTEKSAVMLAERKRASEIDSFAIPKTSTKSLTRADESLSELREILIESGKWYAFKDEHDKLDKALENIKDVNSSLEGGGGQEPPNWWEKLLKAIKEFFKTLIKFIRKIMTKIKNPILKAWNIFWERMVAELASWTFDQLMKWFFGQ